MNVYACSDIHGQYHLFKEMLDDIRFSDDDFLYILGDIIDRGPESIPMLQDIMRRENVICILGNHEFMMYTQYRIPERESPWLLSANGGAVTRAAFEKLSAFEQKQILDFIENMALQIYLPIEGTEYLLSHSDFVEGQNSLLFRGSYFSTVFDIVWNSPWRMWENVPKRKYKKDGRIHVIGHVPVQRIDENPVLTNAFIDPEYNIIDIDLGCASIGFRGHAVGHGLCCMDLTKYARGEGKNSFTYYF